MKKSIIQVKIFQGQKDRVEELFNKFMKVNTHINIQSIVVDKDNGFVCKITVFYKILVEVE